jgi:metal-dependent amidase/aminoacylase/carboxypeptidase family protein
MDEQMASLENRSVSNLIEVMADERWERLAEQAAQIQKVSAQLEATNPAPQMVNNPVFYPRLTHIHDVFMTAA